MKLSYFVMLVFGISTLGQSQGFKVSVTDPRPLWAGVRQLEQKYGLQVNYEDPKYSDTDIVDRSAASYSGPAHVWIPRVGHIEIVFGGRETQLEMIESLIQDHHKRNNAGRFQLRNVGTVLSVVPSGGSVLDAPITLAQRGRTLGELLREVAQNLSKIVGAPVHEPGMVVGSAQSFPFSAANEPASSVLLRAFQGSSAGGLKPPKYVWDLLYAPNYGYVLNVHSVKMLVSSPDGTAGLQEVR